MIGVEKVGEPTGIIARVYQIGQTEKVNTEIIFNSFEKGTSCSLFSSEKTEDLFTNKWLGQFLIG